MTREQLRIAVSEILSEALALHGGKNKGYAYADDGLSNFKKGAARSRQTPIQYLWTLNSKQLLAVEEAIFDGKEVTYEKVEDKLLDNIVYSAIALAMIRHTDQPITKEIPKAKYPPTQEAHESDVLDPSDNPNAFHSLTDWMREQKTKLRKTFSLDEEDAALDETAKEFAGGNPEGSTVLDRGGNSS